MSDEESSSIPSLSSDDSLTHGIAKRQGFSQPVAVAFTINYLIGTGFLTLPWAFDQGGILLSTATFLFVLVICNISKDMVLSAMARAEAMSRSADIDEEGATLLVKSDYGSSDYGSVESDDASGQDNFNESTHFGGEVEDGSLALRPTMDPLDISRKPVDGRYMVRERKFEYVELCRIFLGVRGEQAYIICIALSIIAQLWGYTTVFSSALAEMVPILRDTNRDYSIYTILFGSVVVPLTCLDLKEQKTFQLVLSGGRLFVIAVMILTCLLASFADDESTPHFVGTESAAGAGSQLVNLGGLYSMLSVLIFAFMMHNALPVLSEPVADKKHLSSIYLYAFLVCAVAFWTLGFAVSWFFGDGVEQSCNLLWTTYTGGHPSAIWPKAVSYFVVLFPAVNIISAYPLNAIVLGNNLVQKIHNQREIETHAHLRTIYRVIASSPPIVGALFVRELGVITSYAGVLAIITVLCFPAMMYISSKRAARSKGYNNATMYEGFGSSEHSATMVLVVSCAAAVYILSKLL
eukprot:CAMPEP_0197726256 /NCGR_PEP_ID=MMETSP1434-20131217/14526_1 /TAXON_ID=265543 /ORGANISM="Minutocellus polymorphus, Strain CCMP3303" /LENGTH=520 /DNA_ID=CAMNT_0043312127 /DNA_START=75 /DNA_END=1634 /DNA_ORIENTATION=+